MNQLYGFVRSSVGVGVFLGANEGSVIVALSLANLEIKSLFMQLLEVVAIIVAFISFFVPIVFVSVASGSVFESDCFFRNGTVQLCFTFFVFVLHFVKP